MSVFSELTNENDFDPEAPGPDTDWEPWGLEEPEEAETVGQLYDRVVEAGGELYDYGYRFRTSMKGQEAVEPE